MKFLFTLFLISLAATGITKADRHGGGHGGYGHGGGNHGNSHAGGVGHGNPHGHGNQHGNGLPLNLLGVLGMPGNGNSFPPINLGLQTASKPQIQNKPNNGQNNLVASSGPLNYMQRPTEDANSVANQEDKKPDEDSSQLESRFSEQTPQILDPNEQQVAAVVPLDACYTC